MKTDDSLFPSAHDDSAEKPVDQKFIDTLTELMEIIRHNKRIYRNMLQGKVQCLEELMGEPVSSMKTLAAFSEDDLDSRYRKLRYDHYYKFER